MKYAVIYARYSSERQNDQSIEGQLRICNKYAEDNGLTILDTYIDRAMTGTNDQRAAFQQMLSDCEISKNALSSMQAGGYLPRLENLIKIADYLNCSIDYLLGRDINEITPNGIELYNKLDPEDKAEIRGEIKQMLKADKYNNRHIPYITREIAAYGADETKGTYTIPKKETT